MMFKYVKCHALEVAKIVVNCIILYICIKGLVFVYEIWNRFVSSFENKVFWSQFSMKVY